MLIFLAIDIPILLVFIAYFQWQRLGDFPLCKMCMDSGFRGFGGQGYDDVCPDCGGQAAYRTEKQRREARIHQGDAPWWIRKLIAWKQSMKRRSKVASHEDRSH